MCSLKAVNYIYLRKLNMLNLVISNLLTRHNLTPINLISSIKMVKILNSVFLPVMEESKKKL